MEELGTVAADLVVNGVTKLFAGGALGILIILESRFLLVPWVKKLVDNWVWWGSGRRGGMVGETFGHANKAEPVGRHWSLQCSTLVCNCIEASWYLIFICAWRAGENGSIGEGIGGAGIKEILEVVVQILFG